MIRLTTNRKIGAMVLQGSRVKVEILRENAPTKREICKNIARRMSTTPRQNSMCPKNLDTNLQKNPSYDFSRNLPCKMK